MSPQPVISLISQYIPPSTTRLGTHRSSLVSHSNPRRLHKELIVPLDVGTDQLVQDINYFLFEILLLEIIAAFVPLPLDPFTHGAVALIVLN